jgi:hypothetical protein
MTTDLSGLSKAQSSTSQASTGASTRSSAAVLESMPSVYDTDRQVMFLHLQAEIDTLLLELRTRQQQQAIATIAHANDTGN